MQAPLLQWNRAECCTCSRGRSTRPSNLSQHTDPNKYSAGSPYLRDSDAASADAAACLELGDSHCDGFEVKVRRTSRQHKEWTTGTSQVLMCLRSCLQIHALDVRRTDSQDFTSSVGLSRAMHQWWYLPLENSTCLSQDSPPQRFRWLRRCVKSVAYCLYSDIQPLTGLDPLYSVSAVTLESLFCSSSCHRSHRLPRGPRAHKMH